MKHVPNLLTGLRLLVEGQLRLSALMRHQVPGILRESLPGQQRDESYCQQLLAFEFALDFG